MSAPTGWLTLDQAAEYTGRHRETVRRAAVQFDRDPTKGLRGFQRKSSACWRFKVEDLDRWVMGQAPKRVRAA
ncbi:helix-turn-helix domain-containing protein [Actinophytocola sediminis]